MVLLRRDQVFVIILSRKLRNCWVSIFSESFGHLGRRIETLCVDVEIIRLSFRFLLVLLTLDFFICKIFLKLCFIDSLTRVRCNLRWRNRLLLSLDRFRPRSRFGWRSTSFSFFKILIVELWFCQTLFILVFQDRSFSTFSSRSFDIICLNFAVVSISHAPVLLFK